MRSKTAFTIIVLLTGTLTRATAQRDSCRITADLRDTVGAMAPIWASFGYDEPNATYTADGTKLLSELSRLSPSPVYVRTHNLLTTGDGSYALKWGSTNAYTEDASGKPVYDWRLLDSIFDTYIRRGMKPIAEIGFMPEALSTHPEPYRHHWQPGRPYGEVYTGWAYPPTDYAKWEALVYAWVSHEVTRYGAREVESWYWEVWNEPNIPYWKGTSAEYFRLYDYTARAVKRACPGARVGGPASTGPGSGGAARFLEAFLAHCDTGLNAATGSRGAPLDFISFHAKGSPRFYHGQVVMHLSPELRDAARGFSIVAASRYRQLPVLVTEFDPEGCAACGMRTNPENGYRNGTLYASYTAAAFARLYELAGRYGIRLERATSWSFEFEGQRWFDGFRSLATHGVDKPVLNVFRMFGRMPGTLASVHSTGETPLDSILSGGGHGEDIGALASVGARSGAVMIWNYRDADTAARTVPVALTVTGIPSKKITVRHYRIDKSHSNAYRRWQEMGSPQQVSTAQYRILERAGALEMLGAPTEISATGGTVRFRFSVPGEGVSLYTLDFEKN